MGSRELKTPEGYGPKLPLTPHGRIAVKAVKNAVCKYYGLSQQGLQSPSRFTHTTHPRMMAMALVREFTAMDHQLIAKMFNRRDPKTVLNACTRHKAWLELYPAYRRDVEKITALVKKELGEGNHEV